MKGGRPMDNLLGLIAIAVIYLCIVLRSDKKRRAGKAGKESQAAPQRARGRGREKRRASFEQAFGGEKRTGGAAPSSRSADAGPAAQRTRTLGAIAAQAAGDAFPEADCDGHAPGLHLHEATQEQLRAAGEGEDPCHAGGGVRPAPEQGSILSAAEQAQDSEAARELLRGVILSEILERPCERRARLQNRRRM